VSLGKFLSLQQNSTLKDATSNMTSLLLLFILLVVALLILASAVVSPAHLPLKRRKKPHRTESFNLFVEQDNSVISLFSAFVSAIPGPVT